MLPLPHVDRIDRASPVGKTNAINSADFDGTVELLPSGINDQTLIFEIAYKKLDNTRANVVIDFIMLHGCNKFFYYQPCDEATQYKVRRTVDSLKVDILTGGNYDISFTLLQQHTNEVI